MSNQPEYHIDEQLAAYALGALDADEALQVEEYLRSSQAIQAELQELRDTVGMLPYAAQPIDPPERVRRQLFARIEAGRTAEPAAQPDAPGLAAPVRPSRWNWRSATPALVVALVLMVIGIGAMTFSLQTRLDRLAQEKQALAGNLEQTRAELAAASAALTQAQQVLASTQAEQQAVIQQLASSQRKLDVIEAQLQQEREAFTFVTAPGVATRELIATQADLQAGGEMYMRPGHSEAVVLFEGLPPPAPGEAYVFWLANEEEQIAAGQVMVDADGLALLVIRAPQEVNAFQQVMVTVESSPDTPYPSGEVLLEGRL